MGVKTSNQITISNVSDARAVTVTATSQIFKSVDGGSTFSPDTIQITPVFQGGISYSKWQYSLNGGRTWTDILNGAHGLSVASGVLTIAKTCDLYTDSVTSISFKCLSSNPDFAAVTTITKLYDVTNLLPEIEETKTTISGIETKVDNNTKAISTKATKTDITDSINSYDGSTVNAIRETVATHTTKIGEIQNSVTDVETKVEEKADGSKLDTLSQKVTTMEQNADEFRTEVEKTYAAKDSLKNYSTTSQMNSAISQTASNIKTEVSETYETQANATSQYSAINQRAGDIETSVGNTQGELSKVKQTAEDVQTEVKDARGNSASLSIRVGEITSLIETVDGNASKAQQTADKIATEVYRKQDVSMSSIRYIRDWLKGSSVNTDNYWINCQAWGENCNYAAGIIPTGYSDFESPVSVPVTDPVYYTDENTLKDNNHVTNFTSIPNDGKWKCLQLDFEKIKQIEYITVWHYFAEERLYNHKLQVSQDGETWVTLYDSEKQGTYKETSSGKSYVLNEEYVINGFSSISQDFESITHMVGNTTSEIENWNGIVDELKKDTKDYKEGISNIEEELNKLTTEDIYNLQQAYSKIKEDLEEITSTVQSYDEKYAFKSEITQTSKDWKIKLAQVGLYQGDDIDYQETNFTISSEGAVLNNGEGQEIRMVANNQQNGLYGYYEGDAIFQITRDLTITKRLQSENGIDCLTLKLVPKTYTINSKTYSGIMHVKSGGSS